MMNRRAADGLVGIRLNPLDMTLYGYFAANGDTVNEAVLVKALGISNEILRQHIYGQSKRLYDLSQRGVAIEDALKMMDPILERVRDREGTPCVRRLTTINQIIRRIERRRATAQSEVARKTYLVAMLKAI